ncbi:fungal-specific transcription factor domain-containing protein [Ilyonectria robusta]|uniref:fungal-specific transcription factor domain-containing protein n=1 Tax=Ilyonectria robusta TaxID=1079257 RepID=UPI001E8D3AA7|nr:fungal-specific transcription factor domain-containing protein [Ilyonectria robusta]KAH8738301.1 fungal-specific transcription factor domain-containing protein [Ilyonectria robusta]
MSSQIQHLVDWGEIDQVLNNLDSDYERQSCELPLRGPFSVFQSKGAVASESPDQPLPSPLALWDPISPDVHHVPIPQITDLPSPCPWEAPGLDVSDLPSLDDLQMLPVVDNDEDPALNLSSFDMILESSPVNDALAIPSPLASHMSSGLDQRLGPSISTHANFLLQHYKAQTGTLFSPLRVRKSPWSILHFPRALSALSELNIFNKTKHAPMSLLYSVLAVSAFNWDNICREQKNSTTYWRNVGEGFWRGAKKELEWTCETELAGEKSSKYKDILMAILTMVTITVVTGQQEEARSFLLNAELFISLRGAPKVNKSKKVKLLHAIYLFLRVIEESTYMYPSEKHPLMSPSRSQDKMMFPSLRTHSLCLGRDLDESCGMDFEFGLFGELGTDCDSSNTAFFKEIYGVPQELLSFISRSTYLANEIAKLRNRDPGFSMTARLENWCSELENELCSWNNQKGSLNGEVDPATVLTSRAIMHHLIAAFHCAVIIFFYRRVRQLNPLLLQPYVEKTITNLERFEQEQRNFSQVNCGIVWPGFIAGAEALDPDLQARFDRRLRGCAKFSGMWNFDLAADFLQDLWRLRREKSDVNITWMDMVRDRQLALVLT